MQVSSTATPDMAGAKGTPESAALAAPSKGASRKSSLGVAGSPHKADEGEGDASKRTKGAVDDYDMAEVSGTERLAEVTC